MKVEKTNSTGSLRDPLFLLILAAGIALRCFALGQQSFCYDEIDSVTSASGGPEWSWRILLLNTHGPLYLLLLKGWMGLAGHGDAAVRVLSVLLGSAGLVLFYHVGRRFVGRTASLIALILLAVSPFHIWYSQFARNYVLLVNMGLIAVPAFALEVERRTRGSFLFAFVATAATCLTNLSGFFLFVAFGVYALAARSPSRYPIRRLALFLILSAALLWPWVIEGAGATGQFHLGRPNDDSGVLAVKGEAPPGILSIPFTIFNFSLGYSLGPSIDQLKLERLPGLVPHLWYLIPAGILFSLTAIRGFFRINRSDLLLIFLWIAVPIVIMMALAIFNLKAPNSRYAFLSFAPYLLLIAVGVHSLTNRALKIFVFGLLLVYMGYSDYQYFKDSRYLRPDVRAAGELIGREAGPNDVVVVYALKYLHYYLPRDINLVKPTYKDFSDEETMERWLRRNTAGAERVWIVQLRGWWVDRDDRFSHVCRRLMTQKSEWRFPSLPVYLFETPEDWGPLETGSRAP